MVMAIGRRLGEAKEESTFLRPMTTIEMEIVTIPMTGVAIATPAVPKRRNAEVLLRRRKNAAGTNASLRVVTIRPRRDGIIEIVSTINLRVPREISKNKKMALRNSL